MMLETKAAPALSLRAGLDLHLRARAQFQVVRFAQIDDSSDLLAIVEAPLD
jgi:hypothetical protein